MQNVASGFDKCKFLKDESGKFSDGRGGSSREEVVKPKKPHHDEAQIA
jgi:hypothetical protein